MVRALESKSGGLAVWGELSKSTQLSGTGTRLRKELGRVRRVKEEMGATLAHCWLREKMVSNILHPNDPRIMDSLYFIHQIKIGIGL